MADEHKLLQEKFRRMNEIQDALKAEESAKATEAKEQTKIKQQIATLQQLYDHYQQEFDAKDVKVKGYYQQANVSTPSLFKCD